MLQMVRETAAIKIHYIRQREMKGLGDAILCAKAFMGGEPFAVLLGMMWFTMNRADRPCVS